MGIVGVLSFFKTAFTLESPLSSTSVESASQIKFSLV